VVNPCGSSEPWSVAEEAVTLLAALVVTMGGPLIVMVLKLLSLPILVPCALLATIRKWYVVLAVRLLILAVTLRDVFPF
jgi:hypothetical protein